MKDNINILVVDDNPNVLKIAEKALKPEGYYVEGVAGAKEAMQRIEQKNYDLVLTDLEMTGIDCITLIKWIKQFRPAIGIVALTEYKLQDPIKEAHKLGIISHMRKPFTPGMLKDIISKTIAWTSMNYSENKLKEVFPPALIAELDKVLNQYRKKPGSTLAVLLAAQEIFGYLHPEIQKRIAQGLDMYPSEIHSVVSSYSCFKTKPGGDHTTGRLRGIEKTSWGMIPKTGRKVTNAVSEYIKGKDLQSKKKTTMADAIKILVVDDDPDTLKSFKTALNPEEYHVEGVIRMEDTVSMIKQNAYDLVFTDLKITGTEAISLIREIRKIRPDTGIVVITGYLLPETIKEGYLLGIIDHMMKPFTPSMLKDAINKAIKQVRGNASRNKTIKDFPASLIAELDKTIQQYSKNSLKIIPLLLRTQEIFGYLSAEIQGHIARGLNIYPSEIQNIVSSYSFFKTKPGKTHAPCYLSGSEKVWRGMIPKSDKRALSAVNEFISQRVYEVETSGV